MFVSKRRDLVYPQAEHARLAGTIAAFWGNREFPAPPLPRESFALGVTTHDRGYGELDVLGIGQVDEDRWLATQAKGAGRRSPDPVADTVALMHIRRLVSSRRSQEARDLLKSIEADMKENLQSLPGKRLAFEDADTITEACDMISFRFCFEEAVRFSQHVKSEGETRSLSVHVNSSGLVSLKPWPLSIPELHGTILGYSGSDYPERLMPILVPFSVVPD